MFWAYPAENRSPILISNEFPPLYSFQHLEGNPKWGKWGWRMVSQVIDLILAKYEINWTPCDLVTRFGLTVNDVKRVRLGVRGRVPLKVLIPGDTGVFERDYCLSFRNDLLIVQNLDFFVPAEWTRHMLMALKAGGRRIRHNGEAVLVVTEEGRPLYVF